MAYVFAAYHYVATYILLDFIETAYHQPAPPPEHYFFSLS